MPGEDRRRVAPRGADRVESTRNGPLAPLRDDVAARQNRHEERVVDPEIALGARRPATTGHVRRCVVRRTPPMAPRIPSAILDSPSTRPGFPRLGCHPWPRPSASSRSPSRSSPDRASIHPSRAGNPRARSFPILRRRGASASRGDGAAFGRVADPCRIAPIRRVGVPPADRPNGTKHPPDGPSLRYHPPCPNIPPPPLSAFPPKTRS